MTLQARNVPILSLSRALGMAGASVVVLLGGIIGSELAPSPALATLPISLMIVGAALFAIPAAMLMKRIGRRRGFLAGSAMAGLAALLAAYAVAGESFGLFCLATLFLGANGAFAQQYRFAAAESVAPRNAGRAVSFVLLGSILAGFFGPELAKRTKDWLGTGAYIGPFVSLALVYGFVTLLLFFFRDVAARDDESLGAERPLGEIAAQPSFLVALLAGAVSYGAMSFVMTATPIQLHNLEGYSLDQTAWVIQSHIIAMYLPYLLTGLLLERLGILRAMLIGVAGLFASVALAMLARDLVHYWGALVLLGVGWSFLFVGATLLLTRSYRPAERFKTQAANDFIIFGVQAVASLSAGAVIYSADWGLLNLIVVPFLVLVLAGIVLLRRRWEFVPSSA
jgi:MFS family permease